MTTDRIQLPRGLHLARGGLWWVVSLSLAQAYAVASDAGPRLRLPLTLLFVLTVPGLLFYDLRAPSDPVARVVIGVGASLSFHLILASLWLAPHPLWITGAIVVVYVGGNLAFERGGLVDRVPDWLRGRSRAPMPPPAYDWVPLDPRTGAPDTGVYEPDPTLDEPEAAFHPPPGADDDLAEPWDVDLAVELEAEPAAHEVADPQARDTEVPGGKQSVPADPVARESIAPAYPVGWPPDGRVVSGATAPPSEVGDFVAAPPPVDLNRASIADLMAIPGVGETLAARIVEHRSQHGRFRALGDLTDVPGIGVGRLAALEFHVAVFAEPHTRTRPIGMTRDE